MNTDMNAVDQICDRFRRFAGDDAFAKFVHTLNRLPLRFARLRYWQQALWDSFAAANPDTPHDFEAIRDRFAICELHGLRLRLDAVAALVAPFGEDFQIVAYLHDTVEDTPTTVEEVEANFGRAIAECVSILTDEPGENRKACKAKTNAKLASTANTMALIVKAADRLANLLECQRDASGGKLQMYRREHQAFREAAYRDRLCDDLWFRIDSIILETK